MTRLKAVTHLKDVIDDLNSRFRAARLHGVTAEATRHGKTVIYFRKALGHAKIRLRSTPLTPAFMAEWSALAQGQAPVAPATPTLTAPVALVAAARVGTLRAVVDGYYTSSDFLAKKARTRHVERLVLDNCCLEPIAPGSGHRFGDLSFADLRTRQIRVLQERKVHKETVTVDDADTGESRDVEMRRGTEAGNQRVKCLRNLFEYAKLHHDAEINFAAEVSFLKSSNPTGHATWTEEDVATYEAHYPIGSKERLTLALLLYGGARRGDVVRLGPGMLKLLEGREFLVYTQEKNRDSNPVKAFIPVVPALRARLTRERRRGSTSYRGATDGPIGRRASATTFAIGVAQRDCPRAARCTDRARRASCA